MSIPYLTKKRLINVKQAAISDRLLQCNRAINFDDFHCVKSACIRSYSGPHSPAFELNTERYVVSLQIQSECGKIRTRITPNMGTFYAVFSILATDAK